MSANDPAVDSLFDSLKRFTLLFAHVGELFDPEALVQAVAVSGVDRGLQVHVLSPADDLSKINAGHGDFFLIKAFELLATSLGKCHELGVMRQRVMALLDKGSRVILLSRAPKSRFYGCPGSSLVIDATPHFIDLKEVEITPRWASDIVDGRPQLLNVVHGGGLEGEELRGSLRNVLLSAYTEVGPEIAAWLDGVVFRQGLASVVSSETPALTIEALRGSGIGRLSPDGQSLSLFGRGNGFEVWREALRTYVDETVEVSEDLVCVTSCVWIVERSLRARVRRLAIAAKGKGWKTQCLPPSGAASALEKARVLDFPAASSVADLPNPFAWVTLGELFDLMEKNTWARPPEAPWAFWRLLNYELMPVRNRAAHMHLLEPRDAATALKWRDSVLRVFSVR